MGFWRRIFAFGIWVTVNVGARAEWHPQAQQEPVAKLGGTFIQFQSWMMALDAKDWSAELESMRQAGVRTVVLQWLRADGFDFFATATNDPTENILRIADHLGLQVYLGLSWESAWWRQWNDDRFLAGAAARAVGLARQLARRYGHHASWAGWYIPYELSDSDFETGTQLRLRNFLRGMAQGCAEADPRRRRPVALSVFFEEKLSPKDIEQVYGSLLPGTGLDLLLIQDGVGSRGWDASEAAPYVQAFARAARRAGMRAWTVAESFESVRNFEGAVLSRVPAPGPRFRRQIEVASGVTEAVITFDFFHYLSPRRGPAQKALFLDYLHWASGAQKPL